MKSSTLAKKIGFYAMIIIVWQGLDSADIWPDNIFPSPVDVVEDLRMEFLMEAYFLELEQAY